MLQFKSIMFLLIACWFSSVMATDDYAASKHGGKYPIYPTIDVTGKANAEQIKRGEYLAKVGDCIACHTAPGGQPFAGGLAMDTPFGTLFTPNITPDKQQGIGNWSMDDFDNAMRKGISPEGHYYYPGFPYLYFAKLNLHDIQAIKAYLDAIEPIAIANKPNELAWPFSWRQLQFFWRVMFFDKAQGDYDRGAYLVEGLGHCGMCHTPMHYVISKKWVLGAPNKDYALTGAFVEGFFAPDISASAFAKIPTERLVDIFTESRLLGGGELKGPMAEVEHDSLKYLTHADLTAISSYLKTVKSKVPKKITQSTYINLDLGQDIYQKHCAACHDAGIEGAPQLGNVNDWTPLKLLGRNELYRNVINGIGAMPAKGSCTNCSMEDIISAVNYLLEAVTPAGELALHHSPRDAQQLYQQACAQCHDRGDYGAPIIGQKATWEPLIKEGVDVLFAKAIKHYRVLSERQSMLHLSGSQIEAAVKYIVSQSKISGDYKLW